MTSPAPKRQIVHVDMDAFYASVEQRDDPSLRGKPLLVGGTARRGVVAAASYEARKFGVFSAMPMAEALRRCPTAVVVPPDMARYAAVSDQVFAIFHRYTPEVEGLSLDEAFLDVTKSRSLFGDGETIARAIKAAIRDELSLTASAGVAPAKYVAKVASDLRKPDGLVVVGEDEVGAFLAPLPIERMWGVGEKTAPRLRDLGFRTLGDLARADVAELERVLGSWGVTVGALARGEDTRAVQPDTEAKSIGAESTYESDLTTREAIENALLENASRVAERAVRAGQRGGVVVVKLKYADFTLLSRQKALADPVSDAVTIHEEAKSLLSKFPLKGARVRLTGIALTHLSSGEGAQGSLFRNPLADKRRKIERLVVDVGDKFGGASIVRAGLLEGASRTAGVPTSQRRKPEGR
ncbi:MAG: DNA polymerase IV [Polyangiaceae bacterium]